MEYPQDLLVRTSLAETYMALGRLPAAVREYQAALEVAPDNAWTLNNLAWLRMSPGKAEEAVRPARKAAEIAPGAPEIADTRGMILLEVGRPEEHTYELQSIMRTSSAVFRLEK